jgi:predicted nucleic acid-binding protein
VKVVDASAMIEVLTRTPKAAALQALFDDDLFAPDLLVTEVLHHIRRELIGGRLDDRQASLAATMLASADVQYLPASALTEQIWKWRNNVSMYDATYLAVAHDLRCPLLTTDRRLVGVPGLTVPVLAV